MVITTSVHSPVHGPVQSPGFEVSLNRLYKKHCTLTCSGLRLAKQLDSWEDIVTVIITEVVDSVSGILPSHVSQER